MTLHSADPRGIGGLLNLGVRRRFRVCCKLTTVGMFSAFSVFKQRNHRQDAMAISYQSRFFLFWRQQWHRWQQQWQRQQWQVESTLSGVWQLITGILAHFWQQGLAQLRGTPQAPRLGASQPPAADTAIQAVSAALHLTVAENRALTLQVMPLPRRRPWWGRLLSVFRPRLAATAETGLAPREPCYLACDRANRSLVLLSAGGAPLKTLTPQEQQWVEQRIYYELASYFQQVRQWYRQHHRRRWWRLPTKKAAPPCLTAQFLAQLRISPTPTMALKVEVPALAPWARLWQQLPLFRRGSLSPVRVQGIASQLATRELVLIGSDQSILYTFTAQQQQQILAWIEQHLNPLPQPFHHWLSQAAYWLAGLSPLPPASAPLLAATEPVPTLPTLIPEAISCSSPTALTLDPEQVILDVEAALIGYELHWFEQLLLWCDRLFLWLENWIAAIVAWLKQRFS